MEIKPLSQWSTKSGCGCKIGAAELELMLSGIRVEQAPGLITGNAGNEDAAVWDLGNGKAMIQTVDFFTPVVDDAFDYGAIAAANALSDVYAMGGSPTVALSILGWPVGRIPSETANEVLRGAKHTCQEAGVVIAGGHSIESTEPFFGLSVSGLMDTHRVIQNATPQLGDTLMLTKPLGTGITLTALKRGNIQYEQATEAVISMKQLNTIGSFLETSQGVHALTDITGFGLIGHVMEMLSKVNFSVVLNYNKIPLFESLMHLFDGKIYADMAMKTYSNYAQNITTLNMSQLAVLCDPQTSGGLLISVGVEKKKEFTTFMKSQNQPYWEIGEVVEKQEKRIIVR
jgi:selenide,water dikinase